MLIIHHQLAVCRIVYLSLIISIHRSFLTLLPPRSLTYPLCVKTKILVAHHGKGHQRRHNCLFCVCTVQDLPSPRFRSASPSPCARTAMVGQFCGLPPSEGNTIVITVVDNSSKMVHFIPLPKLPKN